MCCEFNASLNYCLKYRDWNKLDSDTAAAGNKSHSDWSAHKQTIMGGEDGAWLLWLLRSSKPLWFYPLNSQVVSVLFWLPIAFVLSAAVNTAASRGHCRDFSLLLWCPLSEKSCFWTLNTVWQCRLHDHLSLLLLFIVCCFPHKPRL